MSLVNDAAHRASGETYFFRDHGQFDLLRLRLLPELMEKRRGARNLRLWSAGCASGEEVYSLAILVDMLMPERDAWDILILGSDIDQAALAKARHGCYRNWSFRALPPALQRRYFARQGDEWLLDERIRRMATFRCVDLIDEPFLDGQLQNMDLILCRNVFIYFDADAVTAVAEKLAAALGDGGYLITGHTELIGHRVPKLQSRVLADGVVYQRIGTRLPPHAEIPPVHHIVPPPAVVQPPSAPTPAAPSEVDPLAAARQFADRGDYESAERSCRQALAVAPLAAGAHFLLAQLAQLRGNFERARDHLDRTLYLDPGCVAAYLELAALCERAENLPRAQTLRRAALDIVRALPGDTPIEPYEANAAEIAQWVAR